MIRPINPSGADVSIITYPATETSLGLMSPEDKTKINNVLYSQKTLFLPDFPTGGSIGISTETVDIYASIAIKQLTNNQTLFLPDPSITSNVTTTFIVNDGSSMFTLYNTFLYPGNCAISIWNGVEWKIIVSNSFIPSNTYSLVNISSNYTITDWNTIVLINTLGNNINITLPQATPFTENKNLILVNISNVLGTINLNSTQNILPYYQTNLSNILVNQYESLNITSLSNSSLIYSSNLVDSDFTGSTTLADGKRGWVPKPLANQQNYFLRGDSTWQSVKLEIENINTNTNLNINTEYHVNSSLTNIVLTLPLSPINGALIRLVDITNSWNINNLTLQSSFPDLINNQTNLIITRGNILDLIYNTSTTNWIVNYYNVTANSIGLGNVNNTSDLDKPLSTDTQNALSLCEKLINKNQINGYAGLDSNGKILLSALPPISGGFVYLGPWDADANIPTIQPLVGNNGDYYKVSIAGTTDIDGINKWGVGDWILFNGDVWDKIEAPQVYSIFGRIGNIVSQNGDYNITQITNGLSNQLDSGQIFVGDSLGVASGKPMTGDITIDNLGVTNISNNTVTNNKLDQAPSNTWKGNNTLALDNVTDNPSSNISENTSNILNIVGTNNVLNATTIEVKQSSSTQSGYLSSSDWNVFNDKLDGSGTIGQIAKFDGTDNIIGINENSAFNKNFETDINNIEMNGIVSLGTSSNIARSDHVHPSDTNKQNIIPSAIENNFVYTNASGQVIDSGISLSTNPITNDVSIILASSAVHTAINNQVSNVLKLQGTWNASTNTPLLELGSGIIGYAYYVSVPGVQTLLSGISTSYNLGDLVFYDTTNIWNKLDSNDSVQSVNGYTGVVTLTAADLNLGNVDNTSDLNKPISNDTQDALDLLVPQTRNINTSNGLIGGNNLSNDLTISPENYVKSSISTGLMYGGILTNSNSTTFDVSSGFGIIIDNESDPSTPVINTVVINSSTQNNLTFLTTDTQTFILVNTSGNIVQQATQPTVTQLKQDIYLGKINHYDKANISSIVLDSYIQRNISTQFHDFYSALGLINLGCTVSPNGSNMNLDSSGGTLLGNGINSINLYSPNSLDIQSFPLINFYLATQLDVFTPTVNIVPDGSNYDFEGTITSNTGIVTTAVNHRIYITAAGEYILQYGQKVYNTITEAVAGLSNESFIINNSCKRGNSILLGWITVKHTLNALNNSNDAIFTNAGMWGENPTGGSTSLLYTGINGINVSGNTISGINATTTNYGVTKLSNNFNGMSNLYATTELALSSGLNIKSDKIPNTLAVTLNSSGFIGSASTTVDIHEKFDVTMTSSNNFVTVPNPTISSNNKIISVCNVGTNSFTVYGRSLAQNQYINLIYSNNTWLILTTSSGLLSGDVTSNISNITSIENNVVTNNKLSQADGNTWKGNNTNGTSNISDNPSGALTEKTSSILTISGGNHALLNSTSIEVKQSSSTQSGYLSSTDWNTFNNKQDSIINPLTGSGVLGQIAQFDGTNSITGVNENSAFNKNFETDINNIEMNGIVSLGTSSNIARSDHVHPSDSNKQNIIPSAIENNFVYTNASGQVIDSGISLTTNSSTNNNTSVMSSSAVQTAIANQLSNVIQIQGTWNASTNDPTLTSGIGITGYAYYTSVAGTQTLPSGTDTNYTVGDLIFYTSTGIWDRLESSNDVNSVFGRTGTIVSQNGDYNITQITNGLSNQLNSSQLYIGNNSNIATGVSMTGDATLTNTGVLTVSNNSITNAKLAQSSANTWKGNSTGVTANTTDNATANITELDSSILTINGTNSVLRSTTIKANLTNSQIYVGNSSNVPVSVPMTGDVLINNTGVTAIKNSVNLDGIPTLTNTPLYLDNSKKIATTEFVQSNKILNTLTLTNQLTGGLLSVNVNIFDKVNIAQTTPNLTFTLSVPSTNKFFVIENTGSANFTLYRTVIQPLTYTELIYNGSEWIPNNSNSNIILVGATGSTNGSSGLVPQPLVGQQNQFLRGDGTWQYLSYMPVLVISSNTNLVADTEYHVNTTTNAITVTLPSGGLQNGSLIRFIDIVKQWSINSLTINPNGATINLNVANLVLNKSCLLELYYNISTNNWTSNGIENIDNTSDLNKPISTSTQEALDLCEKSINKDQPNGYAGLDSNGKILLSEMPISGLNYLGVWDASTNTPSISSGVGNTGDYYITSIPGSTTIDGISTWNIGDWIIYNSSVWNKIISSSAVSSVNGLTGVVDILPSTIGLGYNVQTITNNLNISEWQSIILINSTSNPITITLPTINSSTKDKFIILKKIDTSLNSISITSTNETIIDMLEFQNQNDSYTLANDGNTNILISSSNKNTWSQTSNVVYNLTSNVGIGTTNPQASLDISRWGITNLNETNTVINCECTEFGYPKYLSIIVPGINRFGNCNINCKPITVEAQGTTFTTLETDFTNVSDIVNYVYADATISNNPVIGITNVPYETYLEPHFSSGIYLNFEDRLFDPFGNTWFTNSGSLNFNTSIFRYGTKSLSIPVGTFIRSYFDSHTSVEYSKLRPSPQLYGVCFMLDFWFYPTSILHTGSDRLIIAGGNNNTSHFGFLTGSENRIIFMRGDGSTQFINGTFNLNAWNYIGCRYTGDRTYVINFNNIITTVENRDIPLFINNWRLCTDFPLSSTILLDEFVFTPFFRDWQMGPLDISSVSIVGSPFALLLNGSYITNPASTKLIDGYNIPWYSGTNIVAGTNNGSMPSISINAGTNRCLSTPYFPNLTIMPEWTFEFSVQINSTSSGATLLHTGNVNNDIGGLFITVTSMTQLNLSIGDRNTTWNVFNGLGLTITSGAWNYVAITYSRISGYRVYVNGVSVNSTSASTPIGTTNYFTIGRRSTNFGVNWSGSFGELRVTPKVLYTSNFTPTIGLTINTSRDLYNPITNTMTTQGLNAGTVKRVYIGCARRDLQRVRHYAFRQNIQPSIKSGDCKILRDGTMLTPRNQYNLTNNLDIVPSGFNMILREDGKLLISGNGTGINNHFGIPKTNSTFDSYSIIPSPNNVIFKKLYTSNYAYFAIDTNNTVWTCGSNNNGELGLGNTSNPFIITPVYNGIDPIIVMSQTRNTDIFSRNNFILDNGNLYGAGTNTGSVLGIPGTNINTFTLIPKISSQNWKGVFSACHATFAWTDDVSSNRLYAVGAGTQFTLGTGAALNRTTFTPCVFADGSQITNVKEITSNIGPAVGDTIYPIYVLLNNGDVYVNYVSNFISSTPYPTYGVGSDATQQISLTFVGPILKYIESIKGSGYSSVGQVIAKKIDGTVFIAGTECGFQINDSDSSILTFQIWYYRGEKIYCDKIFSNYLASESCGGVLLTDGTLFLGGRLNITNNSLGGGLESSSLSSNIRQAYEVMLSPIIDLRFLSMLYTSGFGHAATFIKTADGKIYGCGSPNVTCPNNTGTNMEWFTPIDLPE
jgi:hypothetical protein